MRISTKDPYDGSIQGILQNYTRQDITKRFLGIASDLGYCQDGSEPTQFETLLEFYRFIHEWANHCEWEYAIIDTLTNKVYWLDQKDINDIEKRYDINDIDWSKENET